MKFVVHQQQRVWRLQTLWKPAESQPGPGPADLDILTLTDRDRDCAQARGFFSLKIPFSASGTFGTGHITACIAAKAPVMQIATSDSPFVS